MKSPVLISVLALGFLAMYGQSAENEVIRLKQSVKAGVHMDAGEDDPGTDRPVEGSGLEKDSHAGSLNMSVGTSFSYMKGYGSGMRFFAAPTYTLPLTNRWSLHGGLVASHFTGFNTLGASESLNPGSFSSLAVFGAASYRMNEKLVLHGYGVKQLVTAPVSPLAPYHMDNISLGATYWLGNNISIGASVSFNQGSGYYGNSPFHRSPYNSMPFMSPFDR